MAAAPLTPPHTPGHHALDSNTSLNNVRSSQSHKEYIDSLVVPSENEVARITEIQQEREAEHKRWSRDLQRKSMEAPVALAPANRAHHKPHESLSQRLKDGQSVDDILHAKAATVIQQNYRGYRARREMKGLGLNASTRWTHAIREAQYRETTRPRPRSGLGQGGRSNSSLPVPSRGATLRGDSPRTKWKKAAIIAKRAGLDQDSSDSDLESESDSSTDEGYSSEQRRSMRKLRTEARATRQKDAKTMGLQYFLEMVDLKHRYGSSLRTYHEEWKKSDAQENFFYWLDYGDGRFVDIEGCPRERLDREQVRYLSREERQYYIVKVDEEGRLCWSKNGARIDTTEQWKDSIHGIVPTDDDTPAFKPVTDNQTRLLGDSSTEDGHSEDDASESELEAARAAKYATPGLDEAKGMKKVTHVSAATVMNRLLRKSVKKNTWIFVADTSFRLYVGLKNSGAFQHSSFLQGSRISAAGLIKIKNGRLSSLSPLSGHYRPPAASFRAFVKSLKQEGVDMSHVSISKSYAVLVGLEAYMKTKQKGKDMMKKITHKKDKIISPQETAKREEAERDKSESAAKEKAFLKQQEKERDENKITVQLIQKLKIPPRVPAGQKDGDEGDEPHAKAKEPVKETEMEKEKNETIQAENGDS